MNPYERFLGAGGTTVLPYFGGPFVVDGERRLRLDETAEPGFWRFTVSGRTARPVEPADPLDLSDLPAVRGHFTSGYVVHTAGRAELLALPVQDEPPRFSPVTARRWPSGALLFDMPDFEGETEEAARQAYEERRPLGNLKGAPASLRAAYAYAVLLRMAAELHTPAAPAEARTRTGEIADCGDPAARDVLTRLATERATRIARTEAERATRNEAEHTGRTPDAPRAAASPGQRRGGHAERAETALRLAGATLLDLRELRDGLISVRYAFHGERFATVARADTLQVVDAGICLDHADGLLTLDSLPAAIREAMETGELFITANA